MSVALQKIESVTDPPTHARTHAHVIHHVTYRGPGDLIIIRSRIGASSQSWNHKFYRRWTHFSKDGHILNGAGVICLRDPGNLAS